MERIRKYYYMDITFSIVAYKNYSQIINAVNSINKYTQSYIKEIIIVDNTEGEFLSEYSKEIDILKDLKNVTYIQNQCNLGFGKANNIALAKARGQYFVICNPDIILIEDSFSKIIPYLEENPEVGAVIPRLVDKDMNIEPVYRRDITLKDIIVRYINPGGLFNKRRAYHTMQDMDYSKPFKVPFGQGSFLVVRVAIMKKLNGFDDRYFMYMEDADLCKRVNKVSVLEYFPSTSVIHLWQKGSHKDLKLLKWHFQSMIKYFRKWGING